MIVYFYVQDATGKVVCDANGNPKPNSPDYRPTPIAEAFELWDAAVCAPVINDHLVLETVAGEWYRCRVVDRDVAQYSVACIVKRERQVEKPR
jgi:hypothetical protein